MQPAKAKQGTGSFDPLDFTLALTALDVVARAGPEIVALLLLLLLQRRRKRKCFVRHRWRRAPTRLVDWTGSTRKKGRRPRTFPLFCKAASEDAPLRCGSVRACWQVRGARPFDAPALGGGAASGAGRILVCAACAVAASKLS